MVSNIYEQARTQRAHVEKQDHYARADDSGHGVRDVLNVWGQWLSWNRLNIVKYAFRCGAKGSEEDALRDMRKVIDYAMNEIERLEASGE